MMKRLNWIRILLGIIVVGCMMVSAVQARGENVKITPLGSHTGQFCNLDRAMIFEDPNGTRILYDAGRTVAGPTDPRLGDIDVILVSHMHGDHVGDWHISAVTEGADTCDGLGADAVDATPNSNSVNIACYTGAKIVTGSEMPFFFASRLKAECERPEDSLFVRFGANLNVGGVDITTVPAVHSNGIAPGFIADPTLQASLAATGLTAYVGPPTGYVLTFSNGLVAYLSGDTGITAEQDKVVRRHYQAKLVVMNIGDTFTTGPTEAAFVINELIKPKAVIASHANEAATANGEVIAGTKTATFIAGTKVPVYIPLSGITMEFNGSGKCVSGC